MYFFWQLPLIGLLISLHCFANCEKIDEGDIIEDDDDSAQDFEFDDNKSPSGDLNAGRVFESFDVSDEELCKDVKCNHNQRCQVMRATNSYTAICVRKDEDSDARSSSRDQLKKNYGSGYRKKDNDFHLEVSSVDHSCRPCPAVKPDSLKSPGVRAKSRTSKRRISHHEKTEEEEKEDEELDFVCGSDNLTYSSRCRLNFHNCLHNTFVKVSCKGFCPCISSHHTSNSNFLSTMAALKKSKEERSRKRWEKYLSSYKHEAKSEKLAKYKKTKPSSSRLRTQLESEKQTQNSVVNHNSVEVPCSEDDLKVMGTRLSEWFTVVLADQRRKHRKEAEQANVPKLPDCKTDVAYMFHHLDTDKDLKLSLKELFYLENDARERCIKPYLFRCDEDGDTYLSSYEWCTCFDQKSHPCTLAVQHSRKRNLIGAYIPQCDHNGFYHSTQCHGSSGICWCVDKNGVEFSNTRRRGRPDCEGLLYEAGQRLKKEESVDDDLENDDDDDDIGSGDKNN